MNKEDIIQLAGESGVVRLLGEYDYLMLFRGGTPLIALAKFADLIVTQERNACIAICKDVSASYQVNTDDDYRRALNDEGIYAAEACASKIRGRAVDD